MGAASEAVPELEERTFEGGLIQNPLLLGAADEEGVEAQGVDSAGDALGVLMGAGDEAVAEACTEPAEVIVASASAMRQHVAFRLVMLDACTGTGEAGGLGQVEGREVEADADALA